MQSLLNEPLAIILLILMLFLLLVIALLANVLLGTISWHLQKQKEEEEKEKNTGANTAAIVTALVGLMFLVLPAQAQDAKETVQPATNIGGLSPTVFYFMTAVIAVELFVIFVILLQLRLLIAKQKIREGSIETKERPAILVKNYWNKLNKFRPVEQEAQIDLGHEYDGIRELDNRLPPWWLYGFYITIIFAVVYLWRYHISETAPLSVAEYEIAMRHAGEEKAAYLKKSANNVDENTVTLLTNPEAIAGGKKVYDQFCSPCHGGSGEGTVGPNLTDNYWLHGGSLSDIFKSVKYGWPEKGMRSWKEDLSPVQIAQITSYIKSLQGSNPANAKEKQGELFQEQADPKNNNQDSVQKLASVSSPK